MNNAVPKLKIWKTRTYKGCTKVRQATQRNKKNVPGCIKDRDGSVLMDDASVKRRWTEYIKGLFSDIGREEKPQINRLMCGQSITISEVKEAIKKRPTRLLGQTIS